MKHLRRLYQHNFENDIYLAQCFVVGGACVLVNLAVLSLMLAFGLPEGVCLAGGIAASVVTNFMLTRRVTFSYARDRNIWSQFIGYVGASAVGMAVNYSVGLYMRNTVLTEGAYSLQLAALIGSACGMFFNFLGNRYVVFRKRFIRK